jgi:hypothetical protein
MTRTGSLGGYRWWEMSGPDTSVGDLIRSIADQLIGSIAVNVSWDSGLLTVTPALAAAGWRTVGRLAVSPVIDLPAAQNWPTSDCQGGRFDEWYFFRQVPATLDLRAFCNFGGVSLENARDLAFPDGVDLEEQLRKYGPEAVIGDGPDCLFVITRREDIGRILDSGVLR